MNPCTHYADVDGAGEPAMHGVIVRDHERGQRIRKLMSIGSSTVTQGQHRANAAKIRAGYCRVAASEEGNAALAVDARDVRAVHIKQLNRLEQVWIRVP